MSRVRNYRNLQFLLLFIAALQVVRREDNNFIYPLLDARRKMPENMLTLSRVTEEMICS